MSLPWVEKYRPHTIDEVTSQAEVTGILKRSLQSANLPHLLFYGPPGTGKTSCVLAMARDLFGMEHYRHRILELNASDERGIQVIREKVKEFARLTAGGKCPFKLVILDEADCLTADAQTALRRIMETSVKGTRFVLLCNYVTRIIDPLASRCAKFRFRPINEMAAEERLKEIARLESVQIVEDGGMQELVRVSEGDLRRAIQMLQAIHQLGMPLSLSTVQRQAGLLPSHHPLLANLADLPTVYRMVHEELIKPGYSLLTLLQQLLPRLLHDSRLTPLQLASWLVAMGKVEGALEAGGDEELLAKSILGDLIHLQSKDKLTL